MEGGTRLAVAILVLFVAMICFFFAFHPKGVENVTNPDSALQWLMGEFDLASSSPGSNAANVAAIANTGGTPAEGNVAGIANVPGTNVGP